jgi:hypothetical protein
MTPAQEVVYIHRTTYPTQLAANILNLHEEKGTFCGIRQLIHQCLIDKICKCHSVWGCIHQP